MNRFLDSDPDVAQPAPGIDRLKVPFLPPIDDSEAARERTLIARWGRFVTRHHKPVFVVLLLAGLVLATGSALVRLGASDQGTQPTAQTARRAYDLLAEGFGPGFNGPIPIVIDVNDDPDAPQRVYDGVRNLEGVASASEPQFNDEKTVAIVFIKPDSAPQDVETEDLVHELRSEVVPAATEGSDAAVYVSGLNAAFIDIGDRIMERLPLFLLYIIGVTFIVLAMAFRSIVVSLTAAVTTILSAFIGFGVLTLVFQEGYLLGVMGLDKTGPIETFVPPIAFAILFGLFMDYMVFLMSRIREEHVHGLTDARGGRARDRGDRAGHRRCRPHHGHGLRGVHPHVRPNQQGVRPRARGRDPGGCARREDDPRAGLLHLARREDVVHAALARPAAPEHHDRAAARRRVRASSPFRGSPSRSRPSARITPASTLAGVTEMRLYDVRVTVERIEGRSVCGLEVGDWFEVTESSRVRIPEGRHFCLFALQAVLPLIPAKMRRLPDEDWLERTASSPARIRTSA